MIHKHEEKMSPEATEVIGAATFRVPQTVEELIDYCINYFRGDDGKLRTFGKPVTEAGVKRLVVGTDGAAVRQPLNTLEQIFDYAMRPAPWLEFPHRRSKNTALED